MLCFATDESRKYTTLLHMSVSCQARICSLEDELRSSRLGRFRGFGLFFCTRYKLLAIMINLQAAERTCLSGLVVYAIVHDPQGFFKMPTAVVVQDRLLTARD